MDIKGDLQKPRGRGGFSTGPRELTLGEAVKISLWISTRSAQNPRGGDDTDLGDFHATGPES